MDKLSLNVALLLNSFLELHKCFKVLQINIILCWTIISCICALISQHNVRLRHKPSSITNFSENYFPNFHHDA